MTDDQVIARPAQQHVVTRSAVDVVGAAGAGVRGAGAGKNELALDFGGNAVVTDDDVVEMSKRPPWIMSWP